MYSPVRISTEAPYLLVDLSLLALCHLKLLPLIILILTLRKLRRQEVREGAAHKLKSHRLSDPPSLYQVRNSDLYENSGTPDLRPDLV